MYFKRKDVNVLLLQVGGVDDAASKLQISLLEKTHGNTSVDLESM